MDTASLLSPFDFAVTGFYRVYRTRALINRIQPGDWLDETL